MLVASSSFSEIGNLRRLQLKLQFVCDKGDKFGIRGFSLGIGNCVAEEPLQGIEVASVPCNFDGVADGALDSGRRSLEGLCHLGIENLRDGIDDIHIVDGDNDRFPQILIAFYDNGFIA